MTQYSRDGLPIERAGGAERADLNRPSEIYQRRDAAMAALRSSAKCARCGDVSSKRTVTQSRTGRFVAHCAKCAAFLRGKTRTASASRPRTAYEQRMARLKVRLIKAGIFVR